MTESSNVELFIWNESDITTTQNFIRGFGHQDNTSGTSEEEIMSDNNGSPMQWLDVVYLPLLIILGICGNALTIFVMQAKAFKVMSVSRIMTALAISDTLVVLMVPFNKPNIRSLLGFDPRASLGQVGCNFFFWLFRTSKMTSSWLVVLMSMERFIAVWFPLKAASLSTRRNTIVAIVMIYFFIGGYNGYWGYTCDRLVGGVCVPNSVPQGQESKATVLIILGASIYGLIPSVLLLISSCLVIGKLVRVQKQMKSLSNSDRKRQNNLVKTTTMLMGISIAFIVLVAPIALSHLIGFILGIKIFETKHKYMGILRETTQVMELMNYSTNFLLYVLCGATFRQKALQVFCKTTKTEKNNVEMNVSKSTVCGNETQ